MTKYIFITGGVVSSLVKGIAAASLAAILESRGLKVTLLKLDPYIKVMGFHAILSIAIRPPLKAAESRR